MEGGGSDGGREGEHWCSLTWARCRPCPIMGAGHHSHAVVSWAAIIIGGCSFLFLGVRFHRWAFVCTGGGSSSFIVVGWPSSLLVWCGGKPLVAGLCAVGFVGGRS